MQFLTEGKLPLYYIHGQRGFGMVTTEFVYYSCDLFGLLYIGYHKQY